MNNNLGVEPVKCLLCNGQTIIKDNAFPSYQESITFEIRHCLNCMVAFSMPRMKDTKDLYDKIYKNGSKVRYYDRYWNYAEKVKNIENPLDYLAESEDTYWGVRSALKTIIKDKSATKILEVGSGLGYLTYGLRMAGYDTLGIDISEAAVKNAIINFGNHYIASDVFDFAEKNVGFFDIVILTEVIEHVDNPIAFIDVLLKLIKPSGRIIITTPNKSLYPSNITWSSDLPPVHCWWYSEDSISYIANILNAKVEYVDYSNYFKKNSNWVYTFDVAKPAFDKNGNLLEYENKVQTSSVFFTIKKSLMLKPYFRSMYIYLKKMLIYIRSVFDSKVIICSVRGPGMCAILEKNKI